MLFLDTEKAFKQIWDEAIITKLASSNPCRILLTLLLIFYFCSILVPFAFLLHYYLSADKLCRKKKREHKNSQIEKMEEDFKGNRVREDYRYLKKNRNRYKPQTNVCKNEEGQIVTGRQ